MAGKREKVLSVIEVGSLRQSRGRFAAWPTRLTPVWGQLRPVATYVLQCAAGSPLSNPELNNHLRARIKLSR
jgi:hypothetical protein